MTRIEAIRAVILDAGDFEYLLGSQDDGPALKVQDLRDLVALYDALVKSRSIVTKKPTVNDAVESALSRLEQEVPP